jgi:hypothetical protein
MSTHLRTTQDDTTPLLSCDIGANRAATALLLRQRRRYVRQLVERLGRTTPTTVPTFLAEHPEAVQPAPTPSGHPAWLPLGQVLSRRSLAYRGELTSAPTSPDSRRRPTNPSRIATGPPKLFPLGAGRRGNDG